LTLVESQTKLEQITQEMLESKVLSLILESRKAGEDPVQVVQEAISDLEQIPVNDQEVLTVIMQQNQFQHLLNQLEEMPVISLPQNQSTLILGETNLYSYL